MEDGVSEMDELAELDRALDPRRWYEVGLFVGMIIGLIFGAILCSALYELTAP
jgi:hypothetical protein